MTTTSPQPPPIPCAKCGGQLRKVSAFCLKCGSCGASCRRVLGADLTTLFVFSKLACVALAFAPSVAALSQRMTLEQFLVLSAVCSLVAGLGLCARTVRWWFTLLVGPLLGCGLFVVNLMAGLFIGCTGGFK